LLVKNPSTLNSLARRSFSEGGSTINYLEVVTNLGIWISGAKMGGCLRKAESGNKKWQPAREDSRPTKADIAAMARHLMPYQIRDDGQGTDAPYLRRGFHSRKFVKFVSKNPRIPQVSSLVFYPQTRPKNLQQNRCNRFPL